MPRRFAICVAVALLALGGCKRAKQRTLERHAAESVGADKVEISEDGGRMLIGKRSGADESEIELGPEARIPADFPKSIPIYPGSKLVATVGSTGKGKRSHMLTLSAPAAPDAVHQFYKQRLAALGTVSDFSLGGMRMLSVQGDGGTTVSVIITSSAADQTTLQLSTSPG